MPRGKEIEFSAKPQHNEYFQDYELKKNNDQEIQLSVQSIQIN